MRLARHEMPGMCDPESRPVGYGMIGWREAAIVSDGGPSVAPQITPFPTGRIIDGLFQAFHAWLPSVRPSGTQVSLLRLTQMGSSRARGGRASEWVRNRRIKDERHESTRQPAL
jgi:hypothetical protein